MTLPNFLIIGAMKCGTTAVYTFMQQHPQIFMSEPKEPNFFCFEDMTLDFRRADGSYAPINHESITRLEDYVKLFEGVTNETAVGEASHWYLFSPRAAPRIKRHVPQAKLIAILRNPVERAFSHYVFSRYQTGVETLDSFEEALRLEAERTQGNVATGHYIGRGLYAKQLGRYDALLGEDQLRVYLYEDFRDDPLAVLKNIFEFLDVDPTFEPDLAYRPAASGEPKSQQLYDFVTHEHPLKSLVRPLVPKPLARKLIQYTKKRLMTKPTLSAEAKGILKEAFRDDISDLQDRLGRDLSHWLADKPS